MRTAEFRKLIFGGEVHFLSLPASHRVAPSVTDLLDHLVCLIIDMAGIAEQGNSEKIYRQDFSTKHQTMNAITMNPIQNAVPMLGSC